ncbi:MAG: helix-turn-helix domain-containing protein, partial [Saprospiraceae bacterium]|nr:helix-turn-helix domain-containing protein [Saprospiraceae bacterium]
MLKDLDTVKLIFGLKVAQLRKEKSLSYQQLSDRTGLAISYLHNIEKGKKYPKADKIMVLASALDSNYNYLVSLEPDKKLRPIVDLLQSDFLKIFPLSRFGINLDKLLGLLIETPGKVNAFISTIIKITRNYQLQGEDFHKAALRSYQDLHDNYFPTLEQAAQRARTQFRLTSIPDSQQFSAILLSHYGIRVDRTTLGERTELSRVRSYYAPASRTLFIHPMFVGGPQELMLLAKEIGFHFLGLEERPFVTRMIDMESFEKLFNDFKASYFAVALIMEENRIVEEIKKIA